MADGEGDAKKIALLWEQVKQIQQVAEENFDAYKAGEWTGSNHKRKSKKARIKKLPQNWREALCKEMSSHLLLML